MTVPVVEADFTDENAQKVTADIQEIRTEMPFLINITNDDKKHIAKIAVGSVGWMEEVLNYMTANPKFVPPYVTVSKVSNQVELTKKLAPIAAAVDQVNSMLDSTFAVVGSQAYAAARSFYVSVEDAAKKNVPGAKAIYEELKKRFPGHPKGGSITTQSTPQK